jgi:hypothetical protein
MTSKLVLLWLLTFLVVLHGFIVFMTYPEFRVYDRDEFQKQLEEVKLQSNNSQAVVKMAVQARRTGKHAQDLAVLTFVIDCVMLVFLGVLIIKTGRGVKDSATGDSPDQTL